MQRLAILAALAALLTLATAAPAAGPALPPADAGALWTYITQTDPYEKWGQWPDFSGRQPTRSPHGPMVEVFVNPVLLAAKAVPAPYGAIEVKKSTDKDGNLKNITVQYKVQGFNPEAGDWFWAMYGPDGQVMRQGAVKGCVACHGGRADQDYILAHQF